MIPRHGIDVGGGGSSGTCPRGKDWPELAAPSTERGRSGTSRGERGNRRGGGFLQVKNSEGVFRKTTMHHPFRTGGSIFIATNNTW
jgi:hypothetical protein